MKKDIRIISTNKELKIISDPFRLRIINVYRDQDIPLTVKQCADILGEVPAKVHYHVQKLLDIEILVLDHIEIINGINAKYYKLPKTKIQLQIDDNDEKMGSSLNHVMNVAVSHLENFKIDFFNTTQKALNNKEDNQYEVGWLSSTHLYLSEEEFDELKSYIFEKLEKYNEKDDNKRKYTFITGISKISK